jgi:hypothetical protein
MRDNRCKPAFAKALKNLEDIIDLIIEKSYLSGYINGLDRGTNKTLTEDQKWEDYRKTQEEIRNILALLK